MLCFVKNDASYARRAAPILEQISFSGGNSLHEVRKFPLAVLAVKHTKRDLSPNRHKPRGGRFGNIIVALAGL